jgi:hypothetical protein
MLIALSFTFMVAVMPASAEVVMQEYPWGINYYTSNTVTQEAPATQCAVDGNCVETNDICLVDNSCTKLKSCTTYSAALYYNGSWGMQGGGIHCDDILFHGITSLGVQGNGEEPTEDCNQNGATVIQNHFEPSRKDKHK